MSNLTYSKINELIRKSSLYRNMKTNKIYSCLGYFPQAPDINNLGKGIVIVSDIWTNKTVAVPVSMFLSKIIVENVEVNRFTLLRKPTYQKPVQPLEVQRLHEYEAPVKAKSKLKIKLNNKK